MMLLGTLLEAISVGLVIPVLTLIMQHDLKTNFLGILSILNAFGPSTYDKSVQIALIFLVLVYFLKTAFLTLLSWFQMRFSFGVQQELSKRIYESYLARPYFFFLRKNSADLISIANNEVNLFVGNGILPAISLISELLVVSALGLMIFFVEPYGSLVLMGGYGISILLLITFTKKRITNWGRVRQQQEILKLKAMQEGLGGIKDVKIYGKENFFLERFHDHNAIAAKVSELQGTMQKLPGIWIELMAICGLLTLVFIISSRNPNVASVIPTLGLFASAAFRLMPSVNRILASQHALHYVKPIVAILTSELQQIGEMKALAKNNPIHFSESVEFDRVSYTYEGASSSAINAISLKLKKGESIGLVGASGVGKSTFVDIFLGLLEPTSGQIRVDGVDIQENLSQWRKKIGYVPQSISLLDDSLRNNIAFGVSGDNIDDRQLNLAIKAAQLDSLVSSLPNGIETVIGERGVRLSGGQRQRIGIARALYHNPDILVLDEATSALDTETEMDVMDSVNSLHGIKTILVIAHRLSTLKFCDRIFMIDNGKMIEINKKDFDFE